METTQILGTFFLLAQEQHCLEASLTAKYEVKSHFRETVMLKA
jgi:hypothetical protein